MMLEVCWDGLRTLSFGLLQFHDHNSWLVCEVALRYLMQFSKEVLGIIDRDPSVAKSQPIHINIFRIFFINLRYIL